MGPYPCRERGSWDRRALISLDQIIHRSGWSLRLDTDVPALVPPSGYGVLRAIKAVYGYIWHVGHGDPRGLHPQDTTTSSPTTGTTVKRLVITVSAQKLMRPHGSTYPRKAVAIIESHMASLRIEVAAMPRGILYGYPPRRVMHPAWC